MHFVNRRTKMKLFLVTEKSKLLIFDLQTEKLDAVVTLFTSRPDSYQISSLVCDKDYLWMSTIGGGVLRYHLRQSFFRFFLQEIPVVNSICRMMTCML